MSILFIRDRRSARSNVVLAEYIDGKRKTTQIGTICSADRYLYNRKHETLRTSDPLELVAINEILRFHDAVLNRTYRYSNKSAEFAYSKLSKEDRAKIDDEIKYLTLEWKSIVKKAFKAEVRSVALNESIKLEKIFKDLKNMLK